jgi:hypothetical protein
LEDSTRGSRASDRSAGFLPRDCLQAPLELCVIVDAVVASGVARPRRALSFA